MLDEDYFGGERRLVAKRMFLDFTTSLSHNLVVAQHRCGTTSL
jgi:hypothetical protein